MGLKRLDISNNNMLEFFNDHLFIDFKYYLGYLNKLYL